MAVDLERPVFSDRRKSLFRFVPDRFPYLLLTDGADPSHGRISGDELTTRVTAALEASNPASGSAEAEWLDGLKSPDAVARLSARINQLLAKARQDFDPAALPRRKAALQELFGRAVAVRKAMLQHPVLGALDETGSGRLLPVP
jgi:hypothetical protein